MKYLKKCFSILANKVFDALMISILANQKKVLKNFFPCPHIKACQLQYLQLAGFNQKLYLLNYLIITLIYFLDKDITILKYTSCQ
jgi:hypothetical protein